MNEGIFWTLIVLGFLNFFFLGVRNMLVFEWRGKTRIAISKYCDNLIKIRKYNIYTNYYSDMQIGYYSHMFSFWLWGKKSGIKKEHRNILEKYF